MLSSEPSNLGPNQIISVFLHLYMYASHARARTNTHIYRYVICRYVCLSDASHCAPLVIVLFSVVHLCVVGAGHVAGVQTIMSARLPIIKLVDCGTGIECDLSIENRDGIVKSQIVYIISRIDGRFQKLSFMVKNI